MNPNLYEYVLKHTDLAHPILEKVSKETEAHPLSQMQISKDQGMFMHMLTKLMAAKLCVEVGCFTGYSAIAVASALPSDGKLISLDIDEEVAEQARGYFEEAGLDQRIELTVGDAKKSLKTLCHNHSGQVDLCFIDADKESYKNYFESCLQLLKTGGLIIVDNVMWGGSILDSKDQSPSTQALRDFNEYVLDDQRVERLFLHIADGLYLLRKK